MPTSDMSSALAGADLNVFSPWIARWGLTPDGGPISGNGSRLLPVRRGDQRLMLKVAMEPREIRAAGYLQWLDGLGAAKVFVRQDDALLMERVVGTRSLVAMEDAGEDEAALGILCEVAGALHTARAGPAAGVVCLASWFDRLHQIAASSGDEGLSRASVLVKALLADPRDPRVLHGDLHHWNVLDGGARGWLAIDPNGVAGERAFEFALMVLPTNLVQDKDSAVLRRRARIVARLAGVDPERLLLWVMAQAALWASWPAPGRDWPAVAAAAERAAERR